MHDARVKDGPVAEEGEGRGWTPSSTPEHRLGMTGQQARIIAVEQKKSFLRDLLRKRFVRLCIGLGLFILGAIVYEATVNYGSWTMKAEKPKATPHKGAAPVPKGADPVPQRPGD